MTAGDDARARDDDTGSAAPRADAPRGDGLASSGDAAAPRRSRRRGRLAFAAVTLVAVGLAAWGSWRSRVVMPGVSHEGPRPAPTVEEISLAERLERDVRALAEGVGPRHLGDFPRLAQAAEWLVGRLEEQGREPHRELFAWEGERPENVWVERRGTTRPAEVVVIGAHYDTVEYSAGANDDASGCAALLALAETFREEDTARTLRFVWFVNREPPYYKTDGMGSLVHARGCVERGEDVVAMLSLDCLGYWSDAPDSQHLPDIIAPLYPDTGDFLAVAGDLSSGDLVREVVASLRETAVVPVEGGSGPGMLPGVGWSDHWAFWECGFPAVVVSDTGLYRDPQYHRWGDRAGRLDYDAMARVVAALEETVRALADG